MFYNLVGTNGLLYNYTDVIDTLTFRALITNNNFGMSAAIGLRRLTKWQKALEYPKVQYPEHFPAREESGRKQGHELWSLQKARIRQ